MKNAIASLLLLAGAALAYLLLWPVPIEPQAWTPPPAPALEGAYAGNQRLAAAQRLASGFGDGPEGVELDAGYLYTGYDDGRVVRMRHDGSAVEVLADTGGRPLGVTLTVDGTLVVADAVRGLLAVQPGEPGYRVLADEAGGVPFRFTDDAVASRTQRVVYFSDASHRFGIDAMMADFFEHAPNGRLLSHDLDSGETRVLASGLYFANGVALGPDEAYVLVTETARYRVQRYWLSGERAGTLEPFIENLPGFPDNISYNGRDRFWLALYGPRSPDLDAMLPNPFLRKVVFRLPAFLHPEPVKHGFVLGLDTNGNVVANLQHAGDDAFAPITSAREFGDWLYLGSLTEPALARLPLAQALR